VKKTYFRSLQAPIFLVALFALLFAIPEKGFSQSPDDKNWSSSFGLPGLSGSLINHESSAMVFLHDTLYIGTGITEFSQQILSGVYKWAGQELLPFRGNGSPKLSGERSIIRCIAADSNGRLIIGGSFKTVDGHIVNNIAMWDIDKWIALGPGFNSIVENITCTKSDVYAIGGFDSSGSTPMHRISRWDGKSWNEVGGGFSNGSINYPEKIICIDSIVYVQGEFYWPKKLQKWDGNKWIGLEDHFRRNPSVQDPADTLADIYGMALIGNDIYVCGSFDSVDGIYSPRLAKWDGARWSSVGDYSVIRHSNDHIPFIQSVDGKLYVPCNNNFYTILVVNGVPLPFGAVWDGTAWIPFSDSIINDWGLLGGNRDSLFQIFPGASYVNGERALYSGFSVKTKKGIFAYYDSTQLGINDRPVDCVFRTGKKIFVLGDFYLTGQIRADSIMIFEDGKWSKTDFYDSVRHSIGGKIKGLYARGDSLFIYGSFDSFGQRKTDGLVMFNGKQWITFHDSLFWLPRIFNGEIDVVTTDDLGNIYVGPDFFHFPILQWSNPGWITIPYPNPLFENYNVGQGQLSGGSKGIYLIWQYDSAYIPFSSLMNWDGSQWNVITNTRSVLNIRGSDTSVTRLNFIRYHNRKLIVGGTFSQIDDVKMNNIGFLDSIGWHKFGKGLDYYPGYSTCTSNFPVHDIDFDEEKMYVTGAFNHADSSLASSIAEWDGTRWNSLGSGLRNPYGTNTDTTCGCGNGIAVSDRSLYVGGNFLRSGFKPAHYFSSYSLSPKNNVHQTQKIINQNPLSIFPDPANNFINVSLNSSNEKILKAEIIDELGNASKSFDLKNQDGANSMQFDTHDLSAGIYFMRLFSEKGILSRKFLIVK
jgi:hypothetical protein